MNWFEERRNRQRSVVILKTELTYCRMYDLYLTAEDYWGFRLREYESYLASETRDLYEPMDFVTWQSYEYYTDVTHKSRWDDVDYEQTRRYRHWKAAAETAKEQREYAVYRSDIKPVVVWPDRRRNMTITYKKTGA